MASIHQDVLLNVDADRAWHALRDVGNAARLFAGVLIDSRLDGDTRTVTFESGQVLRERIVDVDAARQRVAYTVLDGGFAHHNASMQIVPEAAATCRFLWTSDVLPDALVANVAPLMEAGCKAMRRNLEGQLF